MPQFFVPNTTPEEAERAYANLAEFCRRPAGPANHRVHHIEWTHDGDAWVATIGERLRGERIRTTRRKRGPVTTRKPLSDPAVVLAIFPEEPYIVVTDARPLGESTSHWANPLMAGRPSKIVLFDLPPENTAAT
jgi:hypothetical protein